MLFSGHADDDDDDGGVRAKNPLQLTLKGFSMGKNKGVFATLNEQRISTRFRPFYP